MDIDYKPIPPQSHNEHVLESKNGVIRCIFLRLMSDSDVNPQQCVLQAVRISNNLNGSDFLSAFEITKGFKRPIC